VAYYLANIDWAKWAQEEGPYLEWDNAAYKQATNSALRMLAKGFSDEVISEITGLSLDEISALKLA